MPPSGAKFLTCWKMYRRASHAIFIHRRGFSTFCRECVASQHVAGPNVGYFALDIGISQLSIVQCSSQYNDRRSVSFYDNQYC